MKIKNKEQLRELYGYPSGRAKDKVFGSLDKHAINFIEYSPFLTISTVSKDGKMDASPRGGQVGFVKVIDDVTIAIPDSKGNNRIDSLTNIVETGTIGTLFLIPGIDEALRVNGNAYLSTDSKYLNLFTSEKNPPKVCVVIKVEEIFLHCAKALMRSRLWHEDTKIDHDNFPTMGQMLKDQIGGKEPAETREEMVNRYLKDL